MLWQIEVLEAVFAGNADVQLHAKKCRAIIEAAVERRKKWVSEFEVLKRAFLRGDGADGSTMSGSTVDKWPVHQASLRSVWSPETGLTNELDANEEFQPPPADAIPFPFDGCHPSSADDDSLRTAVEGAAGADDAGELVAQGSPEAEATAIQGNDDAAVRDSRTGAPNATTGAQMLQQLSGCGCARRPGGRGGRGCSGGGQKKHAPGSGSEMKPTVCTEFDNTFVSGSQSPSHREDTRPLTDTNLTAAPSPFY